MAIFTAPFPIWRLCCALLLVCLLDSGRTAQSSWAQSPNPTERTDLDRALAASVYLEPGPLLSDPRDLLSWQHPDDLFLLIYSAGSDEERLPDPCGADRQVTPSFFTELAGQTLATRGRTVAVLIFCSPFLLGAFDQTTGEGEPKIARRSQLLTALLDRLAERGLLPNQIVLAGQSAGAWASLEAAAARSDKVAGVLALAPAFAGPKDGRFQTWQSLFEDRRHRLAQTLYTPSLIFTFQQDRYGEKGDIAALSALPPVTHIDLPSHRIDGRACRGYHPHRTSFYDCFRRSQLTRIKDFLVQVGQKR